MKFLADENIDLPAVKTLKRLRVDIVSINDAGMREYKDEEILSYAKENERAVITRDTDFLRLHAEHFENAGIVFLTKPLNTGELIKEIQKIEMFYDNLENIVIYIPLK